VFHNIALTLDVAGANWSNIVELNSYHVGLVAQSEALLRVAAEFLVDPYPAWTAVGVTELIFPEAVVEISCVAIIPEHGTAHRRPDYSSPDTRDSRYEVGRTPEVSLGSLARSSRRLSPLESRRRLRSRSRRFHPVRLG
jgi:hypothetical protein